MRPRAAVFALAVCALAQEPPSGVFRIPAPAPPGAAQKETASTAAAEPATPVLTYTGRPVQIPFACTEDDLQTFGMTCPEHHPCPIYTEIASVQSLGLKLFLTGNFHNGSQTMYSLLLASDDGGKTWMEPHERIRWAGLDQVQFADFETGWISGQTLQALPRDPFFLLTRDGGKTWRQRGVHSDTKIARIEQFHFENRTRGDLILSSGSQHERWETQTGGDTWMIREVTTQPLRLRAARQTTSNPDWRLRADARLKAHVLEKREGEQFRRVVSFLVEATQCKPEVAPLQPPPEPEGPPGPEAPAAPPVRPAKPPTLKRAP